MPARPWLTLEPLAAVTSRGLRGLQAIAIAAPGRPGFPRDPDGQTGVKRLGSGGQV
jgi:hypothetical protein